MNDAALQINKQTFLDILAGVQACIAAPFYELGYLRWSASYSTSYWQSLPDGEYTLCVSQGGVRNKEIPRLEKVNLKDIFKTILGESFSGTVKVRTIAGKIVEIAGNQQR
jgi:hypothetical protein